MRLSAHAVLVLALGAVAACSQPPDISATLERYGSHLSSVYTESCNCPEELGYSSLSECSEALGFVGDDELRCLEDASVGYESEVQSYLDCANPVLEEHFTCLAANESCGEGVYELCVMAYDDGVAGCPALPTAVGVEFAACTG